MAGCGSVSDHSTPTSPSTIKPARSISFTDTDPNLDEIGGTLTIKRATDESRVNQYIVYWSNQQNIKLAKFLSLTKPTNQSDLVVTINANTLVANGATHLLVVSKNSTQEMNDGVNTSINDNISAEQLAFARSIRFKDTHREQRKILGNVIITPPVDESDIKGYAVYWADANGSVLSREPITTKLKATPATPQFSIPIADSADVPGDAQ